MLDILEAGYDNNNVAFYWNIIDSCQFKCTYCYATDHNKANTIVSGEHTKSHLFVLERLGRLTFDFDVELQGGEPVLHPDLPNIIQRLERMDRCRRITLATNLSVPVKFYQQFDHPNSKLAIHPSYHVEYHNKLTQRFIDLDLSLEHIPVLVEVILYPKQQYYQQLVDFMTALKAAGVAFGVNLTRENQFWDGIHDDGFFETFQPWIDAEKKDKLSIPIKHVTPSGVTYVDEQYLIQNRISYHGYRCQQQMYSISTAGHIINSCTGERMAFGAREADYKRVITCPNQSMCSCSTMLLFKKVSPNVNNAESN